MYSRLVLLFIFFIYAQSDNKITEILTNYGQFFNFGDKKLSKITKNNLENAILKSKVDVLGEIFKQNIDALKASGKLDLVFLIDASSSIGDNNFKSELKFVKKLMSDVTVDYNHTRVAIITFSSAQQVIKNVDEISNVSEENNKCLLLNRQMNDIKFSGGGTYTLGAFKKAKEIFDNSRNESKKVLLLITDGFSNGGDPVPLATELKKNQVTIFTIGVQNGNYKELYNLSSSPGELYSYLLDSFEEFENLARRALHVDLQSGDYIPLSSNDFCNRLCEEGRDCCDENGVCTCGTSTGHYACVCEPGYYGSGLKNSCLPCPSGSYAEGPNQCLTCPDMHHITIPPANSIQSCKCKEGYTSTKDNQCEVLKCSEQKAPKHGYFVKNKNCGNVLHTACGVRCEVGYTLTGSSIRLCQSNGTWSGDQPSCQVKTCEPLQAPLFGSISCKHIDLGVTYNTTETPLPVDTTCIFSCEKGRTLVGSQQRTCLPLARWDGLRTSCKQIKCNKLSAIPNGKIEPKSCTIGKQPYGKVCNFSCEDGYILEGPQEKSCTGQHGIWESSDENYCKDITPPEITCPENVTIITNPGKKFGTTTWKEPTATDNSGLNVTIWRKPALKKLSNYKFQIGNTTMTYFAQDVFGNKAKCQFVIQVKDIEPPVIEDCESPVAFLSTQRDGANVSWDEPNIFDNSQKLEIIKSHEFGLFPIGTTEVTYTAIDASNNTNVCVLNITVEDAQCETLPDPIYGNSDCTINSEGVQCVITCQEGYALPLETPSEVYHTSNGSSFICSNSDPIWFNQDGNPFPECTVTELPNEIEQNGTVTIQPEEDICNDSNSLATISNDIQIVIEENLKETCENDCKVTTETNCENEEISKYEEETNRIRREAKARKVEVKFQMRSKYTKHYNSTVFEARFKNIKFGGRKNASTTYNVLNRSLEKVKIFCPSGFVFRREKCVQCPKGTFSDSATNICRSCPLGSYNDKPAQTQCISCPLNYSTKRLHVKSKSGCKEQCPPGTHARKKIVKRTRKNDTFVFERATLKPNCRSCPIGTYQSEYGKLKCIRCPENTTTTSPGAVNITQCILKEEVCTQNVCNNGSCIPHNEFSYSCSCDNHFIGTHCEKKMDACEYNPCLNGAQCESTYENSFGFICKCKEGNSGKYCQNEVDEYECFNGGSFVQINAKHSYCLCPDGFVGMQCETKSQFCYEGACENHGECVEKSDSFHCICKDGYIGRRCNILPCDYRPCTQNAVCVNLNSPNATRYSFRCKCAEGYSGINCDTKIDSCNNNPCQNGGTCISKTNSYTCDCKKPFYGLHCEFQKRSDYILHFKSSNTNNYVKLPSFKTNLTAITVCLWMQTSDNFNYGTLLSYATKQYDNALALTDYTGLVFYVNNQYVITDVLLNDGLWHHVCISWSSSDGFFIIYVDGKIKKSRTGLGIGSHIEGGGNLVIGQEQDSLGGKFSQAESFLGKITNFDIWSNILTHQEILNHKDDCKETYFGNLYTWPEFQDNIEGDIKIEESNFCKRCSKPLPIHNGIVEISNYKAFYKCHKGYRINNDMYASGRQCTKASKWEGTYNPYCFKIRCYPPGYLRNGYITGRTYFYGDKIQYNCFEGYTLNGSTESVCKETGRWFPGKPTCQGIQCEAFQKPNNSIITVITENFEDNYENSTAYDIGTQIEISCIENANLTGEHVITCQENGTWDFEPPQCVIEVPEANVSTLPCDVNRIPSAPDNGYITAESENAYGNGTSNIIEYKCRDGYTLNGDNFTTCIVDGYWTEVNVSCDPVLCRPPPKPKNAFIKHANLTTGIYPFGSMVIFECNEGYRMFGNNIIRCLINGKWSKVQTRCSKKSCRKPPVSPKTKIIGNSYLFEDKVTLHCNDGKQYILTCGKTGSWEGDRGDNC